MQPIIPIFTPLRCSVRERILGIINNFLREQYISTTACRGEPSTSRSRPHMYFFTLALLRGQISFATKSLAKVFLFGKSFKLKKMKVNFLVNTMPCLLMYFIRINGQEQSPLEHDSYLCIFYISFTVLAKILLLCRKILKKQEKKQLLKLIKEEEENNRK